MEIRPEIRQDVQDWQLLCRFLPAGWAEQARRLGALQRARGVADAEALLRILMIHLGAGCSLVETAVRSKLMELGNVSSVAIFKRLRASEQWLRWLALEMRGELPSAVPSLQRPVLAVDATTVSESGSTGTDWRVHYAVNLVSLQCEFFELTDVGGGESWRRFPVRRGDIFLGDRIYGTALGIAHVVDQGGDVVVRIRVKGVPLIDEQGKPREILSLPLESLQVGDIGTWPLSVRVNDQRQIPGRLIALRRSEESAARERQRLLRKASRRQGQVSAESMQAAAYFLVWSSLPETYSASLLLGLYRLRWQVELVFKRFKSIMGLGHLPKKDPPSARAWLHGKLFIGLLVEKMLQEADSFSPWGYPLEPPS